MLEAQQGRILAGEPIGEVAADYFDGDDPLLAMIRYWAAAYERAYTGWEHSANSEATAEILRLHRVIELLEDDMEGRP